MWGSLCENGGLETEIKTKKKARSRSAGWNGALRPTTIKTSIDCSQRATLYPTKHEHNETWRSDHSLKEAPSARVHPETFVLSPISHHHHHATLNSPHSRALLFPSKMTDATTSGSQATPGDPNISWPIERLAHTAESEWHPSFIQHQRRTSNASNGSSSLASSSSAPDLDRSNYPDGTKSLSGISLRAFLLGTTLGATLVLTLLLTTVFQTPFWRVPFFVGALSLFHFLEYYVTARYNTRYASVGAFLLTSNGWAYNVAHGSAIVECIVSHFFWPESSRLGRLLSFPEPFSGTSVSVLLILGFVLTIIGQVVRTMAMAQAASNFNHHVQSEHQEGHVLVKTGLYGYLRHPSYFGFFWWGLGTQLVLGNVVCFVGYALVLWKFFSTRIKRKFPS